MRHHKQKFKFFSGLIVTLGLMALLAFQNCSKTQFAAVNPSTQSSDPEVDQVRVKKIFPESTQMQNNQKVKALIVVDNSATMQNSQTNLSANISALLNELSKFEAAVQVVSSTYSDEECQHVAAANRVACAQSALFKYSVNGGSVMLTHPVTGQSHSGSSWTHSRTFNAVPTFSYLKEHTAAQKAAVSQQIANKIQSIGTTGTDYEAPFAVAMAQASRFFEENDRGLIFIITDENDFYSIANLERPVYQYSESANVYTTVPGYAYTVTEPGFSYQGSCSIYNEINQVIGANPMPLGSAFFKTMAECQQAATSSQPRCSLSCQAYSRSYSGSGALDGKTITQVCDELRAGLFVGQTLTQCQEMPYLKNDPIGGTQSSNFLFGLTKAQIDDAATSANSKKMLFVNRFKASVLSRLKEKYLISIATNKPGASNCALGTGQSLDAFFTSLTSLFPARNFSIQSICDTAGVSSEGIAKVAADFVNIISTKYLIGLVDGERVLSARLKLKNSEHFQEIQSGADYEIRNGEFIIVNTALQDFSEIELRISK